MQTTITQGINEYFVALRERQIGAIAVVSALVVGVLDFLIGYELSLTILYIAPVSLAAWYGGGRRMGIAVACACAGLWLATDLTAGHPYTRAGFVYWNAAVHLGFFLAISLLVSTLRSRLDAESRLARTDALTGLANARAIRDAADSVFELCQRLGLPVAIAFHEDGQDGAWRVEVRAR